MNTNAMRTVHTGVRVRRVVVPKKLATSASANDPEFLAAFAHVREAAGPMLARLAKR
jgi:hypothetical protein